jgi:hypothetical protein
MRRSDARLTRSRPTQRISPTGDKGNNALARMLPDLEHGGCRQPHEIFDNRGPTGLSRALSSGGRPMLKRCATLDALGGFLPTASAALSRCS